MTERIGFHHAILTCSGCKGQGCPVCNDQGTYEVGCRGEVVSDPDAMPPYCLLEDKYIPAEQVTKRSAG